MWHQLNEFGVKPAGRNIFGVLHQLNKIFLVLHQLDIRIMLRKAAGVKTLSFADIRSSPAPHELLRWKRRLNGLCPRRLRCQ